MNTVSTVLTFPLGDCFALRAFKNTKARAMKGIIISVVKDPKILAKTMEIQTFADQIRI